MRIGIDARPYFSKELKGIGAYISGLIHEISKIDKLNTYFLYYDSRQNFQHRKLPAGNFLAKAISIKRGDTFFLWEQFALPFAIFCDKVDLFHATANTSGFTNCSRIMTIHDAILQDMEHKRFIDRIYFYFIQIIIAKNAKMIITDSAYSKRCIAKRFKIPKNKIKVIPLGIDHDIFCSTPLSVEIRTEIKKGYGIISPYIFSAGGESSWKNIDRLLKAFSFLVHKYNQKQQLVIVGIRDKNILKSHLSTIERFHLSGRVKILGFIPKEDLVSLYKGAEIFVYPSLLEGFGLPPLEAMACGIPVVASNAASIPEVVGDAALLCNPKNHISIANAINSLLCNDNLKDEMRIKGFKNAKEYQWKSTAEKTLEIYNSVM